MKKKIIFFLPNFSEGGAGNSILKLCKFLKKKLKIEILVVSLGKNSYKNSFLESNIEVIEIQKTKLIFAINDLEKLIKTLIDRGEKLIFVSNINYANLISSIFFQKFISRKFKLILIERTPIEELNYGKNFVQKIKNRIIKFLIRYFYKKASCIIANSTGVAKSLQTHVKHKIQVINPIVEFKKLKKKYNKKKRILWIGRNSFEKNFQDLSNLIEATINENYELIVVTNLFKNKNYEFYKNKYRNLKFINYSNKNLDNLFLKSDIILSTSIYEGFPNIVAEGINYECLIISSKNIGGIHDLIINNNYGVFYEINNTTDLSYKFLNVIKNFNLYKKRIKNSKQNLLKISIDSKRKYLELFKNL